MRRAKSLCKRKSKWKEKYDKIKGRPKDGRRKRIEELATGQKEKHARWEEKREKDGPQSNM